MCIACTSGCLAALVAGRGDDPAELWFCETSTMKMKYDLRSLLLLMTLCALVSSFWHVWGLSTGSLFIAALVLVAAYYLGFRWLLHLAKSGGQEGPSSRRQRAGLRK